MLLEVLFLGLLRGPGVGGLRDFNHHALYVRAYEGDVFQGRQQFFASFQLEEFCGQGFIGRV